MDKKCQQLADMISQYRMGELEISINEEHVSRWINQFSENAREVILSETIFVFQKWFFKKACFINFIENVLKNLMGQEETIEQTIRNTVFVNEQSCGLSQRTIISWLSSFVKENYGLSIRTTVDSKCKNYVYLDDGLYTGSRLKKDLDSLVGRITEGSSIRVYFLVACSSTFEYVSKEILPSLKAKKDVNVALFRQHVIRNNRISDHGKEGMSASYETIDPGWDCLIPCRELRELTVVQEYEKDLIDKCRANNMGGQSYFYRKESEEKYEGVFSSAENRKIVEREFLLKGIEIVKSCTVNQCFFPLGRSKWPSFGLGTFTATEMNISNSCPLVLWWGNNKNQGNALDYWYPLLPRRTNEVDNIINDFE